MARKSPNRKSIKKSESNILWAASAGRCNICGTSLLRDETTGVEVKSGEMAHIVGVEDGPRSPRSESRLTKEERALASNLILLCADHHTEVDKRHDLYSVERLRERKRKFEERIFSLTGLKEIQATQIFRVIGAIRGKKIPDISRDEARELVLLEEGRFPHFALSATGDDAAVDMSDYVGEGSEEYWNQCRAQISKKAAQIADRIADGNAGHISVLALGRIPLLVMLGDALSDATNMTIYHRRNQEGWGWDEKAELPDLEIVRLRDGGPETEVSLACSLTAPVQMSRLDADVNETTLYEIRPVGGGFGADLFDARGSQEVLAKVYRKFLTTVEQEHKACERINLLPAVPADAAVVLGQIRTPGITPLLRVFDFDPGTNQYEFTVEVGA